MNGNRRGVSLMETVVALLILATAFLCYLSLIQTSSATAGHSRNYALATIVAENVLEAVAAHTYGQPAPENWVDVEPLVVREGLPVQTRFQVTVKPDPQRGNGSFFGDSFENFDVLTVVVGWQGEDLEFEMVVRRDHGL